MAGTLVLGLLVSRALGEDPPALAEPPRPLGTLVDDREVQKAVRALSPAGKEALRKKQERFEALSSKERQRLREFHRELWGRPDAERLYVVLKDYHEWLKTLPAAERADILELPPSERVTRIRQLQQLGPPARPDVNVPLTFEDVRALSGWAMRYVERHQQEIIAQFPAEIQQRWSQGQDSRWRRGMLLMAVMRGKSGLPVPTAAEIEDLAAHLSPAPRAQLRECASDEQRLKLIQSWLRFSRSSIFRRLPRTNPEQLMQFYLHELSPEQRAQLEPLPPAEMQAALRRMFLEYHATGDVPRGLRPPDWGPPPNGDGPRRRRGRRPPEPRDGFSPPPD